MRSQILKMKMRMRLGARDVIRRCTGVGIDMRVRVRMRVCMRVPVIK